MDVKLEQIKRQSTEERLKALHEGYFMTNVDSDFRIAALLKIIGEELILANTSIRKDL